jgi:hypothetical protein
MRVGRYSLEPVKVGGITLAYAFWCGERFLLSLTPDEVHEAGEDAIVHNLLTNVYERRMK